MPKKRYGYEFAQALARTDAKTIEKLAADIRRRHKKVFDELAKY